MKSFYLASHSARAYDAERRANDLKALGLKSLHDWWKCLGASHEEHPKLAEDDVLSAQKSDLFVLVYDTPTHGGMLELGVRLAQGLEAHVVSRQAKHFFFSHPKVRLHTTWEEFLAWARSSATTP